MTKNKIPANWRTVELKSLVDSNRTIRYGIVQPGKYDSNGRFMVRGQDYSFGWVESDKLFRVSDKVESKYKNARLKSGDIIITIVGAGTGTASIIPDWLDGANCTQTTARIAIDPEKAFSRYVYHYLTSFHGRKLTYQNIKGGAQPGLNCGDIEKFKIMLPPEVEQRAIAYALDNIDDLINSTNTLISKKELHKKWLTQNLLTGKKRLNGFDGEWQEVRFNEIFKPKKVKAGARSFKVLSVTKDGIVSQEEYFKKEIASKDTSPYLVVQKGDMVMSGLNFWMGSIDVLHHHDIGIVSPAYKVYEIVSDSLSLAFMRSFVRSRVMLRALIGSSVIGASVVRRNLDKEMLENWKFHIPYGKEQSAIATVLLEINKEINLLKMKTDKLQIQKKGMMQVLLTGKKRLKTRIS